MELSYIKQEKDLFYGVNFLFYITSDCRPNGSILVKENYGKDKKTLMAVTPMYKVRGYNPDEGDWFWAKYGPDGNIMSSGKVEGCINCHRARKNQDWIFTEPK